MIPTFSAYIGFLLICGTSIVLADGDIQEVINQDSLGLTIPNPLSSKPLFETNNQNGRYVSINIPYIYEWTFHHRSWLDFKLELSILSGAYSFLWDRTTLEDGESHGPIRISILGFPIYDNQEQPYA